MGFLARFDKAFLFVTFSFLTNFAPKNLITSKNVSMNKRLKSVLLVLLSMVSGMAFGDSTLDDEIEIVNINFSNGLVNSFIDDVELEMMWDVDKENNPNCKWYVDRNLGCAIYDSNRSGNTAGMLGFRMGNISDKYYYDTKLIIEHTGINMNNPNYVGLLKKNGYDQSDQPIYELVGLNTELSSAENGEWVTDEIDLDDMKSTDLKLGIDPNHTSDFQGEWRIRNIRIVGKYRYGTGIEPTVITTLSQLKDIPSHTLIQLNTDRMYNTYYGASMYCVRDETGSIILKTKDWKSEGDGYMGSPGQPFHGTIKGVYDFINRTPTISWITANVETYEDDYTEVYKPIDIEDYWDNIGNSVKVKCRNAILYNEYGWNWRNDFKEINYGDIEVELRAVAVPTDDGQIRFMFNDYQQPNIYLYDDEDYDFPNIDNITQYIYLNRSFVANKWHTFVFPIDFQLYDNSAEFAKYVSCNDGVLVFTKTDNYEAGVPYLIKFNSDKSQFAISIWHGILSNPVNTNSNSDFNFVGGYSSMTPKEGSYYLSANNTIKPISKGGTIKSFRAYFEPTTPNAQMARAISIDGEVTAIEDIDFGDDILLGQPKKIYNLNGQYVGDNLDALPKGVYLVNGKKVTK